MAGAVGGGLVPSLQLCPRETREAWGSSMSSVCFSASPNSCIFFQVAVAIISLFSVAPQFLFELLEGLCLPSDEAG